MENLKDQISEINKIIDALCDAKEMRGGYFLATLPGGELQEFKDRQQINQAILGYIDQKSLLKRKLVSPPTPVENVHSIRSFEDIFFEFIHNLRAASAEEMPVISIGLSKNTYNRVMYEVMNKDNYRYDFSAMNRPRFCGVELVLREEEPRL